MCEVRLLAAQKPVNRPNRWKGKFALFQKPAAGGWGEVDVCPKSNPLPHIPGNQWGRSFSRQKDGGGYMQKPQSALIVIFKLVISGLTSIIFTVLGTVNLHLRGPFVLISLWPILGIVAGIVLGTVRSSVVNFFHLVFWYP